MNWFLIAVPQIHNNITITNAFVFFHSRVLLARGLLAARTRSRFNVFAVFTSVLSYDARERSTMCILFHHHLRNWWKASASQPPIRLFITSIPNVWNRVSSNIWVISRMHIQSHNTLVCQIIVESYKDSQLLLPSFIFLIGFSISLIIFTSQKLFLEIVRESNRFEHGKIGHENDSLISKKSPCADNVPCMGAPAKHKVLWVELHCSGANEYLFARSLAYSTVSYSSAIFSNTRCYSSSSSSSMT